jgi:hypothetical protein
LRPDPKLLPAAARRQPVRWWEVVRRAEGGAWKTSGQGPEAEIDLALELPNGTLLWPVQHVMKRFQLGPEESLYASARSIAAI